jgi:hypothetical protein
MLRRAFADMTDPAKQARREVAALLVIAGAACLYLLPALLHGLSFGPTDLGQKLSLLTSGPRAIHNNLDGDVITQGLSWQSVNWNLIHHGQFPWWNALSGNGLPQYLNFESATLSLPSLVSYLAPQAASLTVAVSVKLLVAGWGTYLCGRVIGAAALPATFGALTFMLSGPITGWLGWSASGVFVWSGAIVAGAVLAYGGTWRRSGVALLALSVAGAVYGGFPEGYVLLAIGLFSLAAATAGAMVLVKRRLSLPGVRRVVAGLLVGVGLSAPLWLPGLVVLRGAARGGITQAAGLPAGEVLTTVTQGYCGLPTGDHLWFCSSNYYETASYVGPLCVILALVAITLMLRRPLVAGLGVTAVVVGLVVYTLGPVDPVQALLRLTPLRVIDFDRMLPLLTFALALLAALGLDATLRRVRSGQSTRFLLWPMAATSLVVAYMALSTSWSDLDRAAEAARRHSLVWPIGLVAAMVVLVVLARGRARAGAWRAGPVLVGCILIGLQLLFLVDAGAGLNSSAATAVPLTPTLVQLRQLVGHGLLGVDGGNKTCRGATPGDCGFRQWTGGGLYPEMNLLIDLPELAVHDPIVPSAYLAGWPIPDAGQAAPKTLDFNFFVPDIDSVRLARLYGVTTVLVTPGTALPSGMQRLATLRGMAVLRVPGSSRFTITRGVTSTPLASTHPADNTYVVRVPGQAGGTLTARITDVPGWSATAGLTTLPLQRTANDLIRIAVPPHVGTVELRYVPRGMIVGLVVGVCALAALVGYLVSDRVRRWGRRSRPAFEAKGQVDPQRD